MAGLEGSISRAAKEFNDLPIKSTVLGVKQASYFNRITREAEIQMKNKKEEKKINDTPTVTPEELENERYSR